jgi:hypothetical protein
MKKEFVLYNLSLRMKQLGFDEPCLSGYSTSSENLEHYSRPLVTKDSFTVDAPTYSQAFRWFREKYDLFGHIEVESNNSFYWHIRNPEQFISSQKSNTYEEAELACIMALINIVEKQNLQGYIWKYKEKLIEIVEQKENEQNQ